MILPPIRGTDKWGSGAYGASRGDRTHRGIDLACYEGSKILSPFPGKVTKIGYPYDPTDPEKGRFRYVEITLDGNRFRYFYVKPMVKVGEYVYINMPIGVSQGLTKLYPGITDHIHLEVIEPDGNYTDPTRFVYG